ncbi:IclR family transcriptional regulator [Variovorax ginsengisoli]|jgi:DNA-binding IclR family transcriptional regulator|uniref:IclR family transcriptional regulator n=1 Tax=Variovorax ginsengisoli TaxID=363844 RepID=A0ABT8RWH4_9BURK|nr:IclR family transcriptional regulator [Variovorax ginsengisoli]MDN8611583.1 IclR family transcriptional regulator [Variovorax ginsengisoli]MDO1530753.1 IclR family transcriptional regulator [Variovorax ginsengisoli]
MTTSPAATGGVPRVFSVIRALAEAQADGARVTQVARHVGLTQATTHRLLQSLIGEGMVEQDERTKLYRLSIDFFALAAKAGNPGNLRELCRPVLLRLCASLGDSIFLLVRSGFEAVCLDRSEGPFPIRSFTGDVGGRVALGVGQGALAILAFLPQEEREEVIRFNLARVREYGVYDEVYLRTEIERVRQAGFAARNSGLLEGMAGVAVPILDREGRAVAALSVGTIADRLNPERLPTVVELLKREAATIGPKINPFDATLRRPAQSLASSPAPQRIDGTQPGATP